MEPFVDLRCVDVIEGLRQLPAASVHCAITSPPYWGLRSYGIPPRKWDDGLVCCFGDEPCLEAYIDHLVEIFSELKRVLHPQGTFWLNIADCYASGGKHIERKEIYNIPVDGKPTRRKVKGMSGKNLLMVPARAALALQADGWILRQDNIWAKAVSFCPTFAGSVMPESTRDRTTWAHEHVYHLALNEDYFYDQDGAREPLAASTMKQLNAPYKGVGTKDYTTAGAQNPSDVKRRVLEGLSERGRNLRNVWIINKQNFKGAHFATFPEKLVEPIVKVGTSAAGACGECHAQYTRQTTLSDIPADVQERFEASRLATAVDTGRTDGYTQRRPNHRRRVLSTEWHPGCSCHSVAEPSVVLDPFNGSGRTGVVARKLGRSYIGIDINPVYVNMARVTILGGQHESDRRERRDSESGRGESGIDGVEARAEAVADAGVVSGE